MVQAPVYAGFNWNHLFLIVVPVVPLLVFMVCFGADLVCRATDADLVVIACHFHYDG